MTRENKKIHLRVICFIFPFQPLEIDIRFCDPKNMFFAKSLLHVIF